MRTFQFNLRVGWLLLPALLLTSAPLSAQDPERQSYVRVIAAHFQVAESEAHILLEDRISPEELPVLLLLARETGIAPTAILAYRRGGGTWMAVARRFDMSPARFHVELSPEAAGPRLERAARLFRDTPSQQWAGLDFSDEEVIGLIHVKVLERYFQLPAARIIEARDEAGSWIAVPTRLGRP
ncbi:MAG: hypothetical protein EA351_13050 [Gemmatimonadales bacterium]|nr:MAG: hypothetical protein EA351_13050 [Gemmatimonadales bacterium]